MHLINCITFHFYWLVAVFVLSFSRNENECKALEFWSSTTTQHSLFFIPFALSLTSLVFYSHSLAWDKNWNYYIVQQNRNTLKFPSLQFFFQFSLDSSQASLCKTIEWSFKCTKLFVARTSLHRASNAFHFTLFKFHSTFFSLSSFSSVSLLNDVESWKSIFSFSLKFYEKMKFSSVLLIQLHPVWKWHGEILTRSRNRKNANYCWLRIHFISKKTSREIHSYWKVVWSRKILWFPNENERKKCFRLFCVFACSIIKDIVVV